MFISQKNYKENTIKVCAKLDSKGRIVIPSEIKRSLGLSEGDKIDLFLNLKEGIIFLLPQYDDQDSVMDSIEVCGTSGPGSNPGPGPEKGDENEC